MPRDSYWRVNDIPIDGHIGPESSHEYGGGYPLDIWLSVKSDSPTGAWADSFGRYQQLLRYQKFAGEFAFHELTSGGVAFTETHSAGREGIPNGTLVVALRPPAGQCCGRGMWALVSSVTDNTVAPDTLCRLEMQLTFLAALEDHPTHSDVQRALEADGI